MWRIPLVHSTVIPVTCLVGPDEPRWYGMLPTVFLMEEASNRNSYQLTIYL